MRNKIMIALLATTLAGPLSAKEPDPSRGLDSVNVPVVTRSDYAFDAAAPDGSLAPGEQARLDAWFGGLNLGYGDRVYVEGAYADGARSDVARVVGRYGMLLSSGSPVAQGVVNPGSVRVLVSRTRASVPNCPNWSDQSKPNWSNKTMPSYGCGYNGNLAAMVADPNDLVWGREGTGYDTGDTGSRAIRSYRNAKPTGEGGLKDISTKKGN
ncbi:MAG: CpaD family pilus assembly lipoprotein [Sphingomicrobium sp.]